MAEIMAEQKTIREINREIKRLIAGGAAEIVIKNPAARPVQATEPGRPYVAEPSSSMATPQLEPVFL
jgi:hypothetical protein